MDTINNGGSAFPHDEVINNSLIYEGESGMTLRDYFAAKAMTSLVAQYVRGQLAYGNEIEMARRSYEIADAMIAARGA